MVWGVENSNICLDSVDIYLDRWCGVLKMPIYVLKLYIGVPIYLDRWCGVLKMPICVLKVYRLVLTEFETKVDSGMICILDKSICVLRCWDCVLTCWDCVLKVSMYVLTIYMCLEITCLCVS